MNLESLALRYGSYREHGYKVEALNPHDKSKGWVLLDPDGAYLMIGSFGGVAPKQEAELEAYRRIAQDTDDVGDFHQELRDAARWVVDAWETNRLADAVTHLAEVLRWEEGVR